MAVGDTCTVDVTFEPTTTGAKAASLDIASDAVSGTQSSALSGTGVAPPPAPTTPPAPVPTPQPHPKANRWLMLYPSVIRAKVGKATRVSAWVCPAHDASPYGNDDRPGTRDDKCQPVRANWDLRLPDRATLSRSVGHTVVVRMTGRVKNTLIATRGQTQVRRARLSPKSPSTNSGVTLMLQPRVIHARGGKATRVSAWVCPVRDPSPYGKDDRPGTHDDKCQPVQANWALRLPEGATLSRPRRPHRRGAHDRGSREHAHRHPWPGLRAPGQDGAVGRRFGERCSGSGPNTPGQRSATGRRHQVGPPSVSRPRS